MLQSVKAYVYDHRKGLSKVAGFAGGVYLVGRYVSERLEEVREKVMQERLARDNLRRRFQQNKEDISYTILAVIPTLSEQVLEEMDVESLTIELQTKSRTSKPAKTPLSLLEPPRPRPPPSESSLSSSIDVVQEQDARSDVESVTHSVSSTSYSGQDATALSTSLLGESAQSSVAGSALSESVMSSSVASDSSSSRTKAELWNEVKMLTFTRTLTTLYSTTLLSLLTTVQLTLLARAKYVHSVLALERDERLREQLDSEFSPMSLLLGGTGLGDLVAELESRQGGLFGEGIQGGNGTEISEEVESKYLTMSWWMLHVGWKDVRERVRRGVEEVFDGVSLKTKLGVFDLHRLISDVRRRVEYEVTFEGTERRINFLSSLLPPTPETIQHVLTQGGFTPSPHTSPFSDPSKSSSSSQLSEEFFSPPHLPHDPLSPPNTYISLDHSYPQTKNPHPHTQDIPFTTLLDETRSVISSSDFERVLEVCLDRATNVLFEGLEKNVLIQSDTNSGEEVRIRLAGLLPGLARWSQLALNGLPNELVDSLMDVREAAGLSAIIFSRFEECF